MTYEAYTDKQYIDMRTRGFHKATGKYPTKEEAIDTIREGRRTVFFIPRGFYPYHAKKRSLVRFMCLELMRLIDESPEEDPIQTIFAFYSFLDDSMGNCNGSLWLGTGAEMMRAIDEIIGFF